MNSGNLGTKIAKEWFEKNSWLVYKVEPELRVTGKLKRGFSVVFIEKGLPDFLGRDPEGEFCAIEVKAAPKGFIRFPCSWVKPEQRDFMNKAKMPCYVGIMWYDGSFELFPYKPKGSYRKS